MDIQKLYSYTRKALKDFNMIQENDKIAIGLSGGKDSLALLYALAGLRDFYPAKFDVVAISVDLGIDGMNFNAADSLINLCKKLNVEYHIINTDIYKVVFDEKKLKNPCSLCAKMRKGALNSKALELGCNKIAYAHHKDDIIETFFMSMFYEGRINTILPVTELLDIGISVIRPLMYISESEIIGFKNKYNLEILQNKCPADGFTKREYVKNRLSSLNRENKSVKNRIFTAILDDYYKKL